MPAPYNGKLLRVDLNTGHSQVEEIKSHYYDLFLGGRGLGAALLYDEVAPGADAMSPQENRLIFTAGPLTGLGASGSAKAVVLCKSPLTGTYLASVTSKGFGVRLRQAGYDALIVQGAAPRLSALVIRNGEVWLQDATPLVGEMTDATEQRLLVSLGSRDYSVAAIGPAGEHGVPYAAIINDGGRAFGRGGAGAVMGAMGLKAIAVSGSGRLQPADPSGWQAALKAELRSLKANPRAQAKARVGTMGSVDTFHYLGLMPVQNFRSVRCEWIDETGTAALEKHKQRNAACPPCAVACTQWTQGQTPDGETHTAEGPEYETIYALSTMTGVKQFPYVIQLDRLCDRLGLDTMSAGVTISFAMECWEKGLLTAADTGDIDLSWGNGAALPGLLTDIAFRRPGIGAALAQGSALLARQVGGDSEAWAMQVKGMELGGYDPRGAKGMALVYAAGPRGGCHHAAGYTIPKETGPGKDPCSEQGKGIIAQISRAEYVSFDCAVICTLHPLGMPDLAALLSPALGRTVTADDLLATGERVSQIERLFNARQGFRRQDDTLPRRLQAEPIADGPHQGEVVRDLDGMLAELYTASGWDLATGIPLPETLRRQRLGQWAAEAVGLLAL